MPSLARVADRTSRRAKAGVGRLAVNAVELGDRAGGAGRYRLSRTFSRTALALAPLHGDEEAAVAARLTLEQASRRLAIQLIERERHTQAVPLLERAVGLHQLNAIEGIEPTSELADLLELLGAASTGASRLRTAVQCFTKVRKLREDDGDKHGELDAVTNLAVVLKQGAEGGIIRMGYRPAAEWFERMRELAVELKEAGAEAEALEERAQCLLREASRDDDTLACAEETVAALERLGPERSGLAHRLVRAHTRVGDCRMRRGEPSAAIEPLRQAIESTQSIPPCPCRLLALRRMAEALERLQEPLAAEGFLREAIAYCRTTGQHATEAELRAQLGLAMADQGHIDAGLQEAETAVASLETMVATDPSLEATLGRALHLLAVSLNNNTSRYKAAVSQQRRSLDVARRLGSKTDVVERLVNLGIALGNIGDRESLQLAVASFREALDVCPDDKPEFEAYAHFELGRVLDRLRDSAPAVEHLEAAARLYRRNGDFRKLARTYGALAEVAGLPPAKAASYLVELASISAVRNDSAGRAIAMRALSRLHAATGSRERAAEYQRAGLRIVESVRARLASSAEREELLAAHAALYGDAAILAFRQNEGLRAFELAEAGRARLTLDRRAEEADSRIENPELRSRRRALGAEIGARLAELEGLGVDWFAADSAGGKSDEDGEAQRAIHRIEGELEQLEAEWKRVESTLVAQDPRLAARARAGIDSVWPVPTVQRELLSENAVLLEYLVAADGCLLFCLTRESFEVFKLNTTADELESLVGEMCAALNRNDPWYPHGHALYETLVEQAAHRVAGKEELLICADGPLHRLPFAALLREEPEADEAEGEPSFAHAWASLPYFLGKSMSIRYIASATTDGMLTQAERGEDVTGDGRVLALAAPLRSHAAPGPVAFPPLPFAQSEIEAISQIFGDGSVTARPSPGGDPPATRAGALELLDGGSPDYRLVHFTTHAALNPEKPWLSALVFEPENGNSTVGYLHANEVMDLDLTTECVTMSGCRTLGTSVSAGEGVVGLALCFRHAGARRVCASLWEVMDESTAKLMRLFYENLAADMSPPAALADAQRTLIAAGYQPGRWAAFGIFG